MNNSTEAPKSATVKVVSPNGFHWLCTVRGDEKESLMADMEGFEKKVLEKGWMPEKPQVFSKFPPKVVDYAEGECPKCQSKLVKGVGKVKVKCENNKWNFQTKQSEGCPFVQWNEMTQADL